MEHSQCWVYYRPADVRLEHRSLECGPKDLLVKVRLCARCGTDQTVFRRGHASVDPYAPVVLGHELVADIVAVGKDVKELREGIGYAHGRLLPPAYLDFRPGERVVCQSRIARYRNGLMLVPKPIANLSFQFDAGYAQYMKVPPEMIQSESVLRVPENISDEAACLVEPAACALESVHATPHAVGADPAGRYLFTAGIRPHGRTCIIGSGTVSMIYARLARREGARQILLLARSEEKAALLRRILGDGFETHVTGRLDALPLEEKLTAEDKLVSALMARTDGELFDDVICACADPDAQRLMPRLYAPEGDAVGACFGGTHALADRVNMDLHHYRAARTIGTSGCSTAAMKTILVWLQDGSLSLDDMVDPRHWTFRDLPDQFFSAAGARKPVLHPWE